MTLPPRFAALCQLDPRSLALFRVGLGGVLLADLAQRADRVAQLVSDAGPVPRAALGLEVTLFPAYLVSGSPVWAHAMSLLAALSALGLIYEELGQERLALEAFRAALVIHPNYESALQGVRRLEPRVDGRDA